MPKKGKKAKSKEVPEKKTVQSGRSSWLPFVVLIGACIWGALQVRPGLLQQEARPTIWPKRWEVETHYVHLHNGNASPVTIIRNFLPIALVEQLHLILEESWANGKEADMNLQSNTDDDDPSIDANVTWLFTSNSRNDKIRSNAKIKERHAGVVATHKNRRFAYSKWELLNQTANEILIAALQDTALRDAVATLPQFNDEGIVGLTDLFFTAYAKGNFLGPHNDAIAGSVAFVLSLAKEWKQEYGGNLEFFCSKHPCPRIVPSFNSAVLFRSRPDALLHQVTEVEIESNDIARRFAVTSWYFTSKDIENENYRRQVRRPNEIIF